MRIKKFYRFLKALTHRSESSDLYDEIALVEEKLLDDGSIPDIFDVIEKGENPQYYLSTRKK